MKKQHKVFLDALQKSGEINMFGARQRLAEEFGLDKKESKAILLEWMKNNK